VQHEPLAHHPRLARLLYRFAYRRAWLDAIIDRWFVRPFLAVFRWCSTMEQRWTRLLDGEGELP